MSNFLKQGRRKEKVRKKKIAKKHLKEVYKILGELDKVANLIMKNKDEVTEENIMDVAEKYTELEIGKYEQYILLGKLNKYIKEQE